MTALPSCSREFDPTSGSSGTSGPCRAFQAAVISTGEEFLRGWRAETSSRTVASWLEAKGYRVLFKVCAGDGAGSIADAISFLSDLCGLVVVTGGLGCTEDDTTVEATAGALGLEVIIDTDLLSSIIPTLRGGFRDIHRGFARCVKGAALVANPAGIAPGQIIAVPHSHGGARRVILLPGPPEETSAVLRAIDSDPVALALVPAGPLSRRVLRLTAWGIPESSVAQALWKDGAAIMAEIGLEPVGTYTKVGGGVEAALEIIPGGALASQVMRTGVDKACAGVCTVPAGIDTEITARAAEAVALALGGATVTAAPLPEVLKSIAGVTGAKLAVAESITGGALGGAIVSVPGSSDYFLGGLTAYSNDVKRSLLGVPAQVLESRGAVSAECASLMAGGAERLFSAGCTGEAGEAGSFFFDGGRNLVAVSCSGIAGPGGATIEKPAGLVYIGVSAGGETMATRHHFTGNREAIIARTVNYCILHAVATMLTLVPGRRERAFAALASGLSEGLGFLG